MAGRLSAAEPIGPTPAEWRAAMGYFPTGVTVVTSWRDGVPLGATISAMCSVSLTPPMLLICLDCNNPLCAPVRETGIFGVNVLGEDDGAALARHFAVTPEDQRFDGCAYRSVEGGAPQLDAAPLFIDCKVEAIHPAGDHWVVIARGLRTDHRSPARPLLYHKGGFPKFSPVG